MPTIIKGQPTSIEVLEDLAENHKEIYLAFSRGKDSLAAWVALKNYGIKVIPIYFYRVPWPGLKFTEESLKYYEDYFQTRIYRYPHPFIYRALFNFRYQPPERLAVIDAAQLEVIDYPEIWDAIKEDHGKKNLLVADGVRAADSIQRRAQLTKHGVYKPKLGKVSPIADWLKGDVLSAIKNEGVDLAIDYKYFQRSFDGIDMRFVGPLREHFPDDYQTLKRWFPLVDTAFIKEGLS